MSCFCSSGSGILDLVRADSLFAERVARDEQGGVIQLEVCTFSSVSSLGQTMVKGVVVLEKSMGSKQR